MNADDFIKSIQQQVEQNLKAAAEHLAEALRVKAPESVRNTITDEASGTDALISGSEIGIQLEYGTSKTPATGWITQTLDQERDALSEILTKPS